MTRRARMLLNALEAGCETRKQIFDHQGCFQLLNNSAAELRAAGIRVEHSVENGEHCYRLTDDDRPQSLDGRDAFPPDHIPLVENPDGQYAMDLAA